MTIIYTAQATQSGTGDPTVNILEWLFPKLTIEYKYLTVGTYSGKIKDLSGNSAPILNKDLKKVSLPLLGQGCLMVIEYVDWDEFLIKTYDPAGAAADGVLKDDRIELSLCSI